MVGREIGEALSAERGVLARFRKHRLAHRRDVGALEVDAPAQVKRIVRIETRQFSAEPSTRLPVQRTARCEFLEHRRDIAREALRDERIPDSAALREVPDRNKRRDAGVDGRRRIRGPISRKQRIEEHDAQRTQRSIAAVLHERRVRTAAMPDRIEVAALMLRRLQDSVDQLRPESLDRSAHGVMLLFGSTTGGGAKRDDPSLHVGRKRLGGLRRREIVRRRVDEVDGFVYPILEAEERVLLHRELLLHRLLSHDRARIRPTPLGDPWPKRACDRALLERANCRE